MLKVKQHSPLVFEIDAPLIKEERWFMYRADAHNDHPASRRDLILSHMETLKECNGFMIDGGDFYCVMQAPGDKRASAHGEAVRSEDRGTNYIINVAEHGTELLQPYANNIALLMLGNHETAMMKYHGIDVTELTAKLLRAAVPKCPTLAAGYMCYVKVNFTKSHSQIFYFHHGTRTNAPVTRGVIQSNRRSVYLRDADFVFTGDSHDGYCVPMVRETFNGKEIGRHTQWHIQTPSYKEARSARSGYEIEKEFGPKPLGCWFIRFFYHGTGIGSEIIPAFA